MNLCSFFALYATRSDPVVAMAIGRRVLPVARSTRPIATLVWCLPFSVMRWRVMYAMRLVARAGNGATTAPPVRVSRYQRVDCGS